MLVACENPYFPHDNECLVIQLVYIYSLAIVNCIANRIGNTYEYHYQIVIIRIDMIPYIEYD